MYKSTGHYIWHQRNGSIDYMRLVSPAIRRIGPSMRRTANRGHGPPSTSEARSGWKQHQIQTSMCTVSYQHRCTNNQLKMQWRIGWSDFTKSRFPVWSWNERVLAAWGSGCQLISFCSVFLSTFQQFCNKASEIHALFYPNLSRSVLSSLVP